MVQVAGVWHSPSLPAPARSAGPVCWLALPDVPRHGGLLRKIPGKVGLELPAGKGDGLCRGWFGSGAGRQDWLWPRGCARALGADRFAAVTLDRNQHFLMKHYFCCGKINNFIPQIGCSWRPCPPAAAAAWFRAACCVFTSVCKRSSGF